MRQGLIVPAEIGRHIRQAPADPGHPQGDGFNAFGYPVSTERQAEAADVMVEQFGCKPLAADAAVREAAAYIEEDNPAAAIMALTCVCDITGAYRIIAVLCTA